MPSFYEKTKKTWKKHQKKRHFYCGKRRELWDKGGIFLCFFEKGLLPRNTIRGQKWGIKKRIRNWPFLRFSRFWGTPKKQCFSVHAVHTRQKKVFGKRRKKRHFRKFKIHLRFLYTWGTPLLRLFLEYINAKRRAKKVKKYVKMPKNLACLITENLWEFFGRFFRHFILQTGYIL